MKSLNGEPYGKKSCSLRVKRAFSIHFTVLITTLDSVMQLMFMLKLKHTRREIFVDGYAVIGVL